MFVLAKLFKLHYRLSTS